MNSHFGEQNTGLQNISSDASKEELEKLRLEFD